MARIPVRITLDSANVPMLSTHTGPTVVYVKEGLAKLKQEIKPTEAPWELTEPQLIFGENIMPMARGVTSVSYFSRLPALAGVTDFRRGGTYRTATNEFGFWAVTTSGKLYVKSVTDATWVDRTAVGWPSGWELTITRINGVTYFHIEYYGTYKFNDDGSISAVTLVGLVGSVIKGIVASVGRLFAYTSDTLMYCSEVDPLDFTPSLVTGAGSTKIQYTRGNILLVESTSFGLFIYAAENVVACQETGNTAAPYLFTEVENSAGITDLEYVATAPGVDAVYAFGSGGLQLVGVKAAVPIFPEISDFLALRTVENYNYTTHMIEQNSFLSRLNVKIGYVASRYFVISFGVVGLTHMLVYDTALRRWGRLKKDHVDIFTINESLSSGGWIPYDDVVIPAVEVMVPAGQMKVTASLPSQETFGVLEANGAISTLDFNIVGVENHKSVAVIGKIKLRRGRECSVQEVTTEGVMESPDMYVGDSVSFRRAPFQPPVAMYQGAYDADSMTAWFLGSAVGAYHNIHIEGMFDLTGFSVVMVPEGEIE